MSQGSFEAKNYMLRKNKDGVIVGFVVHPSDVDEKFLALPVGARLMIGWSEIGDDEKPKEDAPIAQRIEHEISNPVVEGSNPSGRANSKRKFHEMPLSQQCGLKCGEVRFWDFLADKHGVVATDKMTPKVQVESFVRDFCGIVSRSELATNHDAANRWRKLESKYQQWLLDNAYAEARR